MLPPEDNNETEDVSSNEEIHLLKDLLLTLKKNPKVQRALEEQLFGGRALTAPTTRPNGTYYKKFYALQIKEILDRMMVSKEDMIIRFNKFPSISERTLLLRIQQSTLYLIRELDDDGKYLKFRSNLEICHEKGGIAFRLHDNMKHKDGDFADKFEAVVDESESFAWRKAIDEFLDVAYTDTPADQRKLHLKKLNLTFEQMEDIKTSISGLTTIVSSITPTDIILIKLDPATFLQSPPL